MFAQITKKRIDLSSLWKNKIGICFGRGKEECLLFKQVLHLHHLLSNNTILLPSTGLQIQRERDRVATSINSTDPQTGKPKKDIIEELKDSVAILSDENQALKGTFYLPPT